MLDKPWFWDERLRRVAVILTLTKTRHDFEEVLRGLIDDLRRDADEPLFLAMALAAVKGQYLRLVEGERLPLPEWWEAVFSQCTAPT